MNGSEIQGWATLVVAAIGAMASVTAAILAAIGAAKSRRWTGRDHWWQRFAWAVERAESDSERSREVASTTMASLIGMGWSQADDNEMALQVYDLMVRDEPAPPPSEPDESRWTSWRRTPQ